MRIDNILNFKPNKNPTKFIFHPLNTNKIPYNLKTIYYYYQNLKKKFKKLILSQHPKYSNYKRKPPHTTSNYILTP